MTHIDPTGAVIVCTSTREERLAQTDAEPVHFVASEGFRWSDD